MAGEGASGGATEGEERARLLAAKRVHNLYLVENRDIVVQYSVHNVGQAAAINVQLTDSGFRYKGGLVDRLGLVVRLG